MYGREAERLGENYDIRFSSREDRGWMALDRATVDGDSARVTMLETLARVDLPRPLAPGDSVTLRLRFEVKIPKQFDRFGRVGDDYSVAQWYPKMVVRDRDGWALDPFHYFPEFYGEFADYDVAITLPDAQWVGATGVLRSAEGGTNEIPLQRAAAESVTVSFAPRVATTRSGGWPTRELRVETTDGASVVVPRGARAPLRVPAGSPLHYAYVWEESADSAYAERDEAGRPGPLRFLLVARDTSVSDTLRDFIREPAPSDSALPSLKTLRYRAERVHDFAWVASPRYVRADSLWNGVAVRALVFVEDAESWRHALAWTVRALEHASGTVGPYAWPQFTSAEAWMSGSAMEYPMLTVNDPAIAEGEVESLDNTLAHEAAHSWFYGMLGNDERRHAWLDEGFTQYLENDYTERHYPRGQWKRRDRFRWVSPTTLLRRTERSLLRYHYLRDAQPMSRPADLAPSYPAYSVAAYDRPAMMLRSLRAVWGEDAFGAFLRDLYRRARFRHLRPEDVEASARAAAGDSGAAMLRPWIETTALPDVARGPIRREKTAEGWRTTVRVLRKGGFAFAVPLEARFEDGTSETKIVPTTARENDVVFESRSRARGVTVNPRRDVFDAYPLDDQDRLIPPMRWKPLFDFSGTHEVTVLYGPTIWHGEEEGTRLGGWVDGRFLPSDDFPLGIRSFEAGLNVGTRTGDVAWRAGYARRAGMFGARGSLRLFAAKDVTYERREISASNWITESGQRHPWRTWKVTVQDLDRGYGGGRELNGEIALEIRTKGPRRQESFQVSWRHGAPVGALGPAREKDGYDVVRGTITESLDLGPGGSFHVGARLFGGTTTGRVPGDRRFDAAQAMPLETLDLFYWNAGGPLRESEHFWAEGGGRLRGYVGRGIVSDRLVAGSLEAGHDRCPFTLFADVGRATWRRVLQGPSGTLADVGHTYADAGIGVAAWRVRLDAPLWVGTPEPGERPWDVRWVVAFDLPDIRFR
ncbi:MAG TPA: M1 family metallopeptidase [Acidobacteriota bacterium]|nr:M1 family metallopeptidase [Acidobacteriota bacterium]